jgi:hypothetical protein
VRTSGGAGDTVALSAPGSGGDGFAQLAGASLR